MKSRDQFSVYHIEPLARQHDRAAFSCGEESLDRYLKQQAAQDSRKNVSAPFVLVEPKSTTVRGYYTLSMTAIEADALPADIAGKLPKYPLIPATLLGRLAVDQRFKGTGIGRLLLADALGRSLRSEIAWVAVVVDAVGENARSFYEHYGFTGFPDRPLKLFMMKPTVVRMFE